MKSAPWFLALALSAACSKTPTEGSSALASAPEAPGSAHAQSTDPKHADVPTPPPSAGQATEPTATPPATPTTPDGKDIVALGADTQKVVAGSKQQVAAAEGYQLMLAAPAKVASGAEGVATLEIVPAKGWHLNNEFPAKLTVTAPADVALAQAEQKLADASAWSETSGTFTMRFTPSAAGDKKLDANLRFAVCTETTCDPKKEAFSFAVTVE
jgi:hypothetical protein